MLVQINPRAGAAWFCMRRGVQFVPSVEVSTRIAPFVAAAKCQNLSKFPLSLPVALYCVPVDQTFVVPLVTT